MEMGFGETKGWDPNSRCLSCCGARLLCRWRECVVTGLIHFSMCERWLLVGWSEGGWMGFFFVEVMLFYDWWKESAGNLYCIVRVEDKEAWLFPKEEELWVLSVVCFIVDREGSIVWFGVICLHSSHSIDCDGCNRYLLQKKGNGGQSPLLRIGLWGWE